MMFEVAVGDRVRTVSVVRKGGLLHVTLDGRPHVVDARRVSDTEVSLLMQNGAGGLPVQSIDAAFAARGVTGELDVHVLGRVITVHARPSTERMARSHAPSGLLRAASGGSQKIVSPMPGKIVRVLVKTGDQVKAKQGLVVVEAMKMENELRAARDGRVGKLSVTEGQSVDAGAVLLTVD
jgi:biotin carboxyl carrier protein